MSHLPVALLVFALSALASVSAAQTTAKVNLTYVEDAPAPIGALTQADFDQMAASDFTHFVFSFINFCTPKRGGGFTCPGDAPVVVWNVGPIDDPDGTAQKMMAGLTAAGKTLYASIGGAQNAETWAYFDTATPSEQAQAMALLSSFMSTYSITGIDLDMETNDENGYRNFAAAIARNLSPVPPVSIAPYNCANQPYSQLVWQYCNLVGAGQISPTLINRQYYAGGAQCQEWTGPGPDMPEQILTAIEKDLGTFSCQDADIITVTPQQLNPGLATVSTVGGATRQANCEASGKGSSMYVGCSDIVSAYVNEYPSIAGAAFWQWTALKQQNQYAEEINSVLPAN
jgi:hypothetical protein